jgi:hypothetical protein
MEDMEMIGLGLLVIAQGIGLIYLIREVEFLSKKVSRLNMLVLGNREILERRD